MVRAVVNCLKYNTFKHWEKLCKTDIKVKYTFENRLYEYTTDSFFKEWKFNSYGNVGDKGEYILGYIDEMEYILEMNKYVDKNNRFNREFENRYGKYEIIVAYDNLNWDIQRNYNKIKISDLQHFNVIIYKQNK